ncbi:MAG: N-acetylmuramoyl-L-alanine amidase [Myxococcales bacterium]|nr:N-acetylmuramoyl-L-alanine amidase [Myxococcales bacterium]
MPTRHAVLAAALVACLAPPSPALAAPAPTIIDRPIRFDQERIDLTKRYIRRHYGLKVKDIKIVPRAVVVHWTASGTTRAGWVTFNRVRMRAARKHLLRGGLVNVSAHFLVARDGRIYRLMPETWMARHCIGLNYDAIGIENVGGGKKWPLTPAQLRANIALVRYLVAKHKGIRYLLGHMEWKRFEKAPFFRELDPTYRNAKPDPGRRFMRGLRRALSDLKLLGRYTTPRKGGR